MKKLTFFVAVGIATLMFAFGPITVNGSIDTVTSNRANVDHASDSGLAFAAQRTGTEGDDNLSGTTSRDFLLGAAGNDTLSGGDGKDVFQGGDGNDTIYGGRHGDYAAGGENGTDTLYGGPGDDVLDAYDFDEPATPDTVDCGGGTGTSCSTIPTTL